MHFIKIECACYFLKDLRGLPVCEAVQVEGTLVEFHRCIFLLPRRVECLFRCLFGLAEVLLDDLLLLRVAQIRAVVSLGIVKGRDCLRPAFADGMAGRVGRLLLCRGGLWRLRRLLFRRILLLKRLLGGSS